MMNMDVKNGETFEMTRSGVGCILPGYVFAKDASAVPKFLKDDGAVEISKDGKSVKMYGVKGPKTREFPAFIRFKLVNAENRDKVPGKYSAWPKDDGATTLIVAGDKCYALPVKVKAALMTDGMIPDFIIDSGCNIARKDDYYVISDSKKCEEKKGKVGECLWVQFESGNVDTMSLEEASDKSYYALIGGKEVALSELFN